MAMSEQPESSTEGSFGLKELQGIACIIWAGPQSLHLPAELAKDSQPMPIPEEVRQWLATHLATSSITVAPVTLDGQVLEPLLEALLACLKRISPRQEASEQDALCTTSHEAQAERKSGAERGSGKPQVAISTFGRFRIHRQGREIPPPQRNGDLLCKALVCQPSRQASYAWLTDHLWPLSEADRAIEYLYAAATALRTAISDDLLLTHRQTQTYQLADQQHLWIDADAALALLSQADALGRTTSAALCRLEQAVQLFQHGRFLAGVEETWVQARRLHIETMKERALVWLAEAYGQHGKHAQANTLLSEALAEDPSNENLLRALMQTLHESGMTHQALRAYEEFAKAQRRVEMEPAEATTALYEQLRRAPQVFDLSAMARTVPQLPPLLASSNQRSEGVSLDGSNAAALPGSVSNDGEGTVALMGSAVIEIGAVPAGENAVLSSPVTDERFASSFPGVSFGIMVWGIRPK
jgi:DNA-binding SARP family transcriptional activator